MNINYAKIILFLVFIFLNCESSHNISYTGSRYCQTLNDALDPDLRPDGGYCTQNMWSISQHGSQVYYSVDYITYLGGSLSLNVVHPVGKLFYNGMRNDAGIGHVSYQSLGSGEAYREASIIDVSFAGKYNVIYEEINEVISYVSPTLEVVP